MKSFKCKFLLIIFILIQCIFFCFGDTQKRTVRLGVCLQDGFYYKDASGKLCGYAIDYLNNLAINSNWNLEFVYLENSQFSEKLDELEKDNVDLLAYAQVNKERQSRFLFSATEMGTSYTAIYTKSTRTDLQFDDTEQLASLKLGTTSKSVNIDKFLEEVRFKGIKSNLVYYDSYNELRSALDKDEIDGIVLGFETMRDDERLLYRFNVQPIYFVTRKDEVDLMDELNRFELALTVPKAEFLNILVRKFYPYKNKQYLTKLERDYVKTLPTLTIALPRMRDVFSVYNEKTDSFTGIYPELLDEVARWSGLEFDYVPLPDEVLITEKILVDDIDLIIYDTFNHIQMLPEIMVGTNEFLPINNSFYMPIGTKESFSTKKSMTIATCYADNSNTAYLSENFPNFNFLRCKSVKDAIKLVKTKKADALLTNIYAARYYLGVKKFDDLAAASGYSINSATRLVMEPGSDVRLLKILNKGVNEVLETKGSEITFQNVFVTGDKITLPMLLGMHPYFLFLIFAFIMALITVVVVVGYQKKLDVKQEKILTEKNKELENALHLSELDALTGVYNSVVCADKCKKLLKENENTLCAMLMMDVDNFKRINTKFSYNYGDEVLLSLGANMQGLFPNASIFGRIGSNKFLAFFPKTDLQIINDNIENYYTKMLELFSRREEYTVTCCIGVYFGKAGIDSYYDLFKNTDKTLRQAKKTGKNRVIIDSERGEYGAT